MKEQLKQRKSWFPVTWEPSESWEYYLVLQRVARPELRTVDWQFLEIYSDVLSDLEELNLLMLAQERPVLTDKGLAWLNSFQFWID